MWDGGLIILFEINNIQIFREIKSIKFIALKVLCIYRPSQHLHLHLERHEL